LKASVADLVFAAIHTLGPLALLAFWLGSAGWTISDTRRRCPNRTWLWGAAAAGVPILGAGFYALVRPCEDRRTRYTRDLWLRYLEAELEPGERCLACLTPVEADFRCCPGCGDPLARECEECGALLRFGWIACPHCLVPATRPRRELVAA
jgi:hypothetical protein